MRKQLAALALLATVPGCALPGAPNYGPAPFYETTLQARLMPTGMGSVSFHISEPAYTAVFMVDPVFGISMVYPRSGYEAQRGSLAGMHTVWSSLAHQQGGRARASSAWFTALGGGYGGMAQMQPRIYYLIASPEPLRVTPYIGPGSSMALRMHLGHSQFMSANPYARLDDLAQLVVPRVQDGNWAADVYFEWPDAVYDDTRSLTRLISCDGRRLVVPLWVNECPPSRATAPPVAMPDSARDDGDARPVRPDPRRPERGGRVTAGDPSSAPPGEATRPDRATRPERVREPRRGGDATRSADPGSAREPRGPRDVRPTREGTRRDPGAEPAPRPRGDDSGARARPASPPSDRASEPRSRPVEPSRPARTEPRSEPAPRAEPPRADPPRAEPAPRAEPPAE